MTADLAAFLRARLDEDKAVADEDQYGVGGNQLWYWHDDDLIVIGKERLLADIDAKRRIIDRHVPLQAYAARDYDDHPDPSRRAEYLHALDVVLRDLALPWRDHPDYRAEEWAP